MSHVNSAQSHHHHHHDVERMTFHQTDTLGQEFTSPFGDLHLTHELQSAFMRPQYLSQQASQHLHQQHSQGYQQGHPQQHIDTSSVFKMAPQKGINLQGDVSLEDASDEEEGSDEDERPAAQQHKKDNGKGKQVASAPPAAPAAVAKVGGRRASSKGNSASPAPTAMPAAAKGKGARASTVDVDALPKAGKGKATLKVPPAGNSSGGSTSAPPTGAAAKKKAGSSSAGPSSEVKGERDSITGRRKIKIQFIEDDSRRHITFSKRKAGIMKKVSDRSSEVIHAEERRY